MQNQNRPLFLDTAKIEAIQNTLLGIITDEKSPLFKEFNKAINSTVQEKLFAKDDVLFALQHLREQLENDQLMNWAQQIKDSISDSHDLTSLDNYKNKKVVALLAGNLPLVGFQDVLALLLFGAESCIKLSKKDPYLINAFLDVLYKKGLIQNAKWGISLADFHDFAATHWLFTGNQNNFLQVKNSLETNGVITQNAHSLVRKAGVSVALLPADYKLIAKHELEALATAIHQYEGKGCRSVGIIVYADDLALTDVFTFLNQYFSENNEAKISELHQYQLAFLTACGFKGRSFYGKIYTNDPTAWQKAGFISLINERDWQKGIIPAEKIQSVYTISAEMAKNGLFPDLNYEPIALAQKPELFWKADGIDTLEWLINAK